MIAIARAWKYFLVFKHVTTTVRTFQNISYGNFVRTVVTLDELVYYSPRCEREVLFIL